MSAASGATIRDQLSLARDIEWIQAEEFAGGGNLCPDRKPVLLDQETGSRLLRDLAIDRACDITHQSAI
jgi:hypothetical protein